MTDLPVWIGVIVAGLVGLGGWITAAFAIQSAQRANELAEASNGIAKRAVKEAKASNRIANGANKLSQQANTLVEGQIGQQNEDWYVKWKPKWEKDSAMLVLTNEGRDAARNVSCVVSGDGIHEIGRPGIDVAPGEVFRVHLPVVTEQRNADGIEAARRYREMERAGIIWVHGGFKTNLEVTVIWKTGLGTTQDQTFNKSVS